MNSVFRKMEAPDLTILRSQLRAHYAGQWDLMFERHPIGEILDAYDREHPGLNAYQLKAAQYRILAENLKTLVYDESPFYFMTDSNRGVMAGDPNYCPGTGGWLYQRNKHQPGWYDHVHYAYPVGNVVKYGLRYYYEKAAAAMQECKTDEERDFLQTAMTGLRAAKALSEKFADTAEARLAELTDPKQIRFMQMIANTARRVPWESPKHFYEGLNTMWFCRDLLGELDGIGNAHLGRPDLILYDLYQKDIETGYITKEEAYDLVSRFLTHGDCEYDKNSKVEKLYDHELEMGYTLGGCDRDGNEVYNEVTKMFIYAHRAQRLIYPKPHCRFSASSSEAYLNDLSEDFVMGRSVNGLINDDAIIPFLVSSGKSLEDARSYVNYGCWNLSVEGMERETGNGDVPFLTHLANSIYGKEGYEGIDDAESFEDVYRIYYGNTIRHLRETLLISQERLPLDININPMPLYSIFMDGCLEKRKDFLAGGSKYTLGQIGLYQMANAVDALLAIKTLCFDKKELSLKEFLNIVRSNWKGHEMLRQSLRKFPHYGDENQDSTNLIRRLIDDLYRDTREFHNGFGVPLTFVIFIYQQFRWISEETLATPDGRRDGDVIEPGVGQTRLHDADPIPAVLSTVAAMDPNLTKIKHHSLTIQLPAGRMNVDYLSSLIRTMADLKMRHIQINCIDPETLLDAQKHPEDHQDLVVRVVGFSAKFVALSPKWQDEFIQRVVYDAS